MQRAILYIFVVFVILNKALLSYNNFPGSLDRKTISGRIIDAESNHPLPGANVLIKNTNIGVSSDDEGFFSIKTLPSPEFELQITMIGYKPVITKVDLIEDQTENMLFKLKHAMIEMGSVVVTGTNSLHLYEDVSVKTEIIPKKLIRQQNAFNLAEALGLQTGVMVENDCNNCNFTQVRILGFDGKYSQILIDGDPVVSSLGGVYGLEHYPKEMIEQIEIVKGGGSSLYGGGAVAGTINMMTRRPAFNNTKVSYNGSSIDGSYDQQLGAFAEIVSDDNRTGFYIYGSTRNRESYDRNGDGYSELGKLKNETIGFNGYIRPANNSELQLSFHRIFEDRRGGGDFDRPVHEADIAEWTEHFKWGGKIKWTHNVNSKFQYKINYAFSLLERNSYYGGLAEDTPEARLEALNYYGHSDNPLHTGGMQVNYITGSHSITSGIQYDRDELLDKSVSNEAYYVDETFENLGIYLQDEISLDQEDHLQMVAGVRVDNHSALEDWIVSPRINAKYELFDALKLRAGFATGFKAPQIFDEDLHICGLEGTQRVIRNSDGLKAEKSYSYSFGLEFQDFVNDIPMLFGVTGFFTKLNDAYADEFIKSDGNVEYWERINSSGADVKGVEIDFGIKPVKPLEIRSGFTFKENKYKDEVTDFNTKNFMRTPDIFGYVRTAYDFSDDLNMFISMKYTGSMYVPHEIAVDRQEDPLLVLNKTDSFVEFDMALSYKINLLANVSSTISAGLKNITNAYQDDLDYGVQRDPGYVYGPSSPRTVYFSIDLAL